MTHGLTYWGHRDSTLRTTNMDGQEKWFLPLSDFTPLCEIKRGQLCSIATADDIKNYCEEKFPNDSTAYDTLMALRETFVTLTDIQVHDAAVGIAREYSAGVTSLTDMPDHIHLVGQGQVNYDPMYNKQSGLEELDGLDLEAASEREYLPDFLKNYKENIGLPVYAKGGEPGNLTIIESESYLSYRNIIRVGLISDAENSDSVLSSGYFGSIEVGIEGDQRGPIDSTQLELEMGEDVVITKNDPVRVFAIGTEDDASFKMHLSITPTVNVLTDAFISFSRLDGKAYTIFFGSSEPSTYHSDEDAAHIAFANSVNRINDGYHTKVFLGYSSITEDNLKEVGQAVVAALQKAAAHCSYEFEDYTPISTLNQTNEICKAAEYYACILTADQVGGYYDVFISNRLRKSMKDTRVQHHGSFYNKGKAVLADIRIGARHNIAGILLGNQYREYTRGEQAIFLKMGVYENTDYELFTPGQEYYLEYNGCLSTEQVNRTGYFMKAGVAETAHRFVADFRTPRSFLDWEESLGTIRPTANNIAEQGYILADGQTAYEINTYSDLYEYLKVKHGVENLNSTETYELSTSFKALETYYVKVDSTYTEHKVYAEDWVADTYYTRSGTFTVPKICTNSADGADVVYCQIKWSLSSQPLNTLREPYMLRVGQLEGSDSVTTLPELDISSLITWGPAQDKLYVDNIEQFEIKLFVDLRDDVTEDEEKVWTEVTPGFKTYNNDLYYGYKWRITKTAEASTYNTYGQWKLYADIDGSRSLESEESVDLPIHGIWYERDPFQKPISLVGHWYKLFIVRREVWPHQFNLGHFVQQIRSGLIDEVNQKLNLDEYSKKIEAGDISADGITINNLTVNESATLDVDTFSLDAGTITVNGTLNISNSDYSITNEAALTYTAESTDTLKADLNAAGSYSFVTKTQLENAIVKAVRAIIGTSVDEELYNRIQSLTDLSSITSESPLEVIKNQISVEEIEEAEVPTLDYLDSFEGEFFSTTRFSLVDYLASKKMPDGKYSVEYSVENKKVNNNLALLDQFTYYKRDDTSELAEKLLEHSIYSLNGTTYEKKTVETDAYQQTYELTDDSWAALRIEKTTETEYYESEDSDSDNDLETPFATYTTAAFKFLASTTLEDRTEDAFGATLYAGAFNSYSSYKVKNISQEQSVAYPSDSDQGYLYTDETTAKFTYDTASASSTFEKDSESTRAAALIDNALQMFYELPTASYRYKNMPDGKRRLYGVIVERVEATIDQLEKEQARRILNTNHDALVEGNTLSDRFNYNYTDSELYSIKEYMSMMLTSENDGLNVSSSVGLLAKAAGETQARLLALESSVFGYDADTTPGARSISVDNSFSLLNHDATYLGTNRLVKYLTKEIFGDIDPTVFLLNADDEDGSTWNTSLSRIDYLDNEVNGSKATEDSLRIPLDTRFGKTYFNAFYDDVTNNDGSQQHYTVSEVSYDDGATETTVSYNDGDIDRDGFLETTSYEVYQDNGAEFDGLNEAVNRIALKLNNTAAMLTDFDTASTQPIALDRIRANITTLLNDVYDEDYFDVYDPTRTDHQAPFIKNKESRIDAAAHKLFDYKSAITIEDGQDRITSITRDGNEKTFVEEYDQSVSLNKNASLLEIVADQIGGDHCLLRTYADKTQFLGTTDSYADTNYFRRSQPLLTRVQIIEKFLDRVSQYSSSGNYHFEYDPYIRPNDGLDTSSRQRHYYAPVRLDNYLPFVDSYFGVDFNSMAQAHMSNSTPSKYYSFSGKLDPLNLRFGSYIYTPSSLKLQDNFETAISKYQFMQYATEDIAARLKIAEYENKTIELLLGDDYYTDNWYKWSPATVRSSMISTDDAYNANGKDTRDDDCSNVNTYNLTSDLKAILRLLNGKSNATTTAGATSKSTSINDELGASYSHYSEATEYSELNDTLTKIYQEMYKMPKRYIKDSTWQAFSTYDKSAGSTSTVFYDNSFDQDHSKGYYDFIENEFEEYRWDIRNSDSTITSVYGTPLSNSYIDLSTDGDKTTFSDIVLEEFSRIYKLLGLNNNNWTQDDHYNSTITQNITVDENEVVEETLSNGKQHSLTDDGYQWNNLPEVDQKTAHEDLAVTDKETDVLQKSLDNFKLVTNYSTHDDVNDLFGGFDEIYKYVFVYSSTTDVMYELYQQGADRYGTVNYDPVDGTATSGIFTDEDQKLITIDLTTKYAPSHTYIWREDSVGTYASTEESTYAYLDATE